MEYSALLDFVFFFFKQKTAYEMLSGDWSSDVCSSDLGAPSKEELERAEKEAQREIQVREALETQLEQLRTRIREQEDQAGRHVLELTQQLQAAAARVEEAEARAAAPGGAEAAQRLAAAERFAQETGQHAREI